MAEPTRDFIKDREARAPAPDGLLPSVVRYSVAWLLAAGTACLYAPKVEVWGEGWMRIALCALAGGLAVLVAFVLGLGLRIRVMGRDWHRVATPAWCGLATSLAAQHWNREIAAWIVRMPPEQTTLGEDLANSLFVCAWGASVVLLVNFPQRARAGLGFAETFSATKRRWLLRAGCVVALAAGVACLVPAPLAGYWHTPYSDCLCASKNLLVFEDGHVFRWASGHGLVKEPYGTYRRHYLWVTWDTGTEIIELRPGWFFMRLRPPAEEPYQQNITRLGCREWRRDYIREVLATKPKGTDHSLPPL
jgi:hypothetical protein